LLSPPGVDINVDPLYGEGDNCVVTTPLFGEGVVVVVNDDGLFVANPDLDLDYLSTSLSYNYETDEHDPTPVRLSDDHGTSVAGLISAIRGNDICIDGIAPLVTLGARAINFPGATVEDFVDAFTSDVGDIDVLVYPLFSSTCYINENNDEVCKVEFGDGLSVVIEETYETATEDGAILVVAAGDDGEFEASSTMEDPFLRSPDIIAVAGGT
ncbi:peptidase S8, subtilisin-related, partial [Kipferlia bialata]